MAAKLAQALRERAGLDGGERAADLELVALATVADVVALRGENRRLVREGLRALAATVRPGPARADARSRGSSPWRSTSAPSPSGSRRGSTPRVASTAPTVALELLLTDDVARAAELADELDHANAERRDIETRIRFEAEALVAAQGPAPAYVLAGARLASRASSASSRRVSPSATIAPRS